MITDIIADFVTGRQNLTPEDIDGWRQDLRSRGEDDDYLFVSIRSSRRSSCPSGAGQHDEPTGDSPAGGS
jgi:hypothetical protein